MAKFCNIVLIFGSLALWYLFSGTINFVKLLIQNDGSPAWLGGLLGPPAGLGHLSELGQVRLS